MYKVSTVFSHYLAFRQLGFLGGILLTAFAFGQTAPQTQERKPASYVPDDDVIVKPIQNELSFYQQYVASDVSNDVVQARNQLKVWNDNQNFAEQYGLDSTLAGSPYFVPTPEEKWQYFKDRYLRYLRRRGEQPIKDMPKNWYQEYRASNEVDTIDEMEARFRATTKVSREEPSNNSSPAQEMTAKQVWKKTRFIFQPRLDQGLVIVGFRSPIAYARAWVGVNGETEVNVQQSIDSIGFRLMYNYFAHSGKYFTSADQRIMENVYVRYTTSKDPDTKIKDDTLMLLYAKQF
jgi:hypothetical protein